jgi:hypothetical protein
MFNTIITTVALAVMSPSTPTSTPPARFDVSDIEVSTGSRSTHWATFDAEGDQSGEVVVWVDADNQLHLDANFADGLYMSALVDSEGGGIVDPESYNAAEVVERLSKISAFLDPEPPPGSTEGTELLCYASAVLAATCLTGNLLGCVGGGAGVVCNCMPLWEKGYIPPGCPGST